MSFTLAEMMLYRMYPNNVRFGGSTVDELSPTVGLRKLYEANKQPYAFQDVIWMHHPIFHASQIRLNHLHIVVQGWSPRNKYSFHATLRRVRKDIAIESPAIKARRPTAADVISKTFD